jgi:predicted Zn-dependent protease with MMP-like domain
MEKKPFEELVEKAFETLPEFFRERVDNVQIIVEDYPSPEQLRRVHAHSYHDVLGLYEGIPLERRGTWYGMSPTVPDRISLFQKNIEAVCRSEKEIEAKIQEVLIHEIGHYFGMSEDEIRAAGY